MWVRGLLACARTSSAEAVVAGRSRKHQWPRCIGWTSQESSEVTEEPIGEGITRTAQRLLSRAVLVIPWEDATAAEQGEYARQRGPHCPCRGW